MQTPSLENVSNPSPLATASGTAIYKQGDCLVVADLGIHWAGTTRFVLGLLCFITTGNGLVLSILDIAGGEGTWIGGLILLTVGFLTGLVLKSINGRVRSRRLAPLGAQEKKVIIDLTQKQLFTRVQDGATIQRATQCGASPSFCCRLRPRGCSV